MGEHVKGFRLCGIKKGEISAGRRQRKNNPLSSKSDDNLECYVHKRVDLGLYLGIP